MIDFLARQIWRVIDWIYNRKKYLAALLSILLTGCATPYVQPPHTKLTDNCLYDNVYLACLDTAQIKFKAVADGGEKWSLAEARCSNMAYSSSLRNSTKVESRCQDLPHP